MNRYFARCNSCGSLDVTSKNDEGDILYLEELKPLVDDLVTIALTSKTAKKHKTHVLDKALGIDEDDVSITTALPNAADSQEAPFDE